MAATGLSADPEEYRERLAEQSDDQIDAWAAELMRDVAIRRGVREGRRGLPAARPASTSANSNGCSHPAAARRRRSGATRAGDLMVPAITLFALVPGIRAQVGRRPRPTDRLPGRELRRARLRLTPIPSGGPSGGAGRDRLLGSHRGWLRLGHPFPSVLDGLVCGAVAILAGAEPGLAAAHCRLAMILLQLGIGITNDLVDAPADAGRKPGKPIPAGLVGRGTARAVAIGAFGLGIVLRRFRGAGRRRPRLGGRVAIGLVYDLAPEGNGLVVAAVRRRDPAPAGLRLVARGRPRCRRRSLVLLPVGRRRPGRALAIGNALVDLERDRRQGHARSHRPWDPAARGRWWLPCCSARDLAAVAIASAAAVGSAPPLLAAIAASGAILRRRGRRSPARRAPAASAPGRPRRSPWPSLGDALAGRRDLEAGLGPSRRPPDPKSARRPQDEGTPNAIRLGRRSGTSTLP